MGEQENAGMGLAEGGEGRKRAEKGREYTVKGRKTVKVGRKREAARGCGAARAERPITSREAR